MIGCLLPHLEQCSFGGLSRNTATTPWCWHCGQRTCKRVGYLEILGVIPVMLSTTIFCLCGPCPDDPNQAAEGRQLSCAARQCLFWKRPDAGRRERRHRWSP